jgi:hypothetical protein
VKAWELIRDAILTIVGILLAIHEAYSKVPNDAVIVLAMTFTAPAAYGNVRALLSGSAGSSSLRHRSESESSAPSQSQEASGEQPAPEESGLGPSGPGSKA